MSWIELAFEKNWFYICALIIGALYAFGGLVHVGNILGFGEQKWLESPVAWRVGDIGWGLLDFIAITGIVMRSPIGIWAVVLAGVSQIVIYGLFPDLFALTEEHRAALKGMVYFHAVVLVVLGGLIYAAGARSGS